MTLEFNFEAQRWLGLAEAFNGCFVGMSFPGPGIELVGDGVASVLSEGGHAGAFRQVLSEEPVGVFAGAALPGMVRSGKVELHPSGRLD